MDDVLENKNDIIMLVDQWLDEHGDPSNRKKKALPYCKEEDRLETENDITWSLNFSGGFGDGGYVRKVTFDKQTKLFKTSGITGFGYSNIGEIFSDYVKKYKFGYFVYTASYLDANPEMLDKHIKKYGFFYMVDDDLPEEYEEGFILYSVDPVYCFMAAIGIDKKDMQLINMNGL